ncbi:YceI family protein [Flavobacterium sp. W1B]|uniref:YceI family protein n=1 Tax=Flavobacterium sp. W1B TaxID=3394146 RepID=UPI0039BD02DB
MKKLKTIGIILTVLLIIGSTQAQTNKIDTSKSKITWTGKKITGEHQGTINFKEGHLVMKNNMLTGGKFVVDMTSMVNTDQTGKSKLNLEGHLKSDDFFGTQNFPTSTLTFKNIEGKGNGIYGITADLTIKGITKPVKFDLMVKDDSATAKLTIDRTKYDIKYRSGSYFEDLGDKTIYNDFELDISLKM